MAKNGRVLMANKPKPRHTNRLTVKKIARLKTGRHIDGGGLSLLVSPIGSKSWTFRFERNGRDRAMVLGPLHGNAGARAKGDESRGLTLDEARNEAAKAMALLKSGIDPIDARRDLKNGNALRSAEQIAAAAKVKTFEQAAIEYYDAKSSEWTNLNYRGKFLSSLRRYAFPVIGSFTLGVGLRGCPRFLFSVHLRAMLINLPPVPAASAARWRGKQDRLRNIAALNLFAKCRGTESKNIASVAKYLLRV
jgi:hypothetical protein